MVTVTLPVPPEVGKLAEVAFNVYVQVVPLPVIVKLMTISSAWFTRTFTVQVPGRLAGARNSKRTAETSR